MNLNPSQSIVATTFDRPLAVMAGAGSGKTATLKERIANAFDDGVVDSIDEVLAITFTEKAALELKSRIKSTLRTRGGNTAKQALQVDGAWISTIHGMCARILRENAFALGIDPMFTVLSEDGRADLLDSCIESVLASSDDLTNDIAALSEEYSRNTLKDMIAALVGKASSSPQGFSAICSPNPQLGAKEVAEFSALVYSYDALQRRRAAAGRARAQAYDEKLGEEETNRLVEEAEKAFDAVEELKTNCQKRATTARMVEFVDRLGAKNNLEGVGSWCLPWAVSDEAKNENDGTDDEAASKGTKGRSKAKGANDKYPTEQNIRLFSAYELWQSLFAVSEAAHKLFQQRKQSDGVFDNNDLLVQAAYALENNTVRAEYENKFKLVMIDEFQDTDQTQLDIIKVFAGPNMERLCVVGDPQQSIYRFRGADLSVCQAHVDPLLQADEGIVKPEDRHVIYLDNNYRSHNAILAFSDIVFGPQPECETAEASDPLDTPPNYYQQLQHGRNETKLKEEYPNSYYDESVEGPRVVVNEIQHKHKSVAKARALGAQQIARRFKDLHEGDKKRSYGDMVVLLGSMKHADVYAKALAELDIPCAITGGSIFKKKVEPNLIVDMVRMLANPYDSEALLSVLTSDVFALTKTDLMEFDYLRGPYQTINQSDGSTHSMRKDVTQAFMDLLKSCEPSLFPPRKADADAFEDDVIDAALEENDGADANSKAGEKEIQGRPLPHRLERAVRIVADAYSQVGRVPVSALVEHLLLQSGWIDRQKQADEQTPDSPATTSNENTSESKSVNGLMRVANALKAIRMIKALEEEGCCGARNIAEHLAMRLEETKEAPGVLSANNSAFVRIMTIHASKGLEFPVVAVSEITDSNRENQEGKMYLESVRGITYPVLDLQRSIMNDEPIDACLNSYRKKEGVRRALESVGRTTGTDHTFFEIIKEANNQGDLANYYYGVRLFGAEQKAEELERKLYVAFTRAKEALIINLYNEITVTDKSEFDIRFKEYCNNEKAKNPERYAKPRRNSKLPQKEQDEIERRIQEVDALINSYLKEHVSFEGLKGNLEGRSAVIQARRKDIVGLEGGGSYLCCTPPQLEKWAATGILPPFGDASNPDAGDGVIIEWEETNEDESALCGTDMHADNLLVPVQGYDIHPHLFRYSSNWSEGVLSASSIKSQAGSGHHSYTSAKSSYDVATEFDIGEMPAKATEKGTAFHSAGQYAAEAWKVAGQMETPPAERIDAIARLHGLNTEQSQALHSEVKRWCCSNVAQDMAAHEHLVAEVPFFLQLNDQDAKTPLFVNGFIDLLAYDDEEPSGKAFVVDYKTGMSLATPETRRAAYEVQAQVYAYALLQQGFEAVSLQFVFVEQDEKGVLPVEQFPSEGQFYTSAEELRNVLVSKINAISLDEGN